MKNHRDDQHEVHNEEMQDKHSQEDSKHDNHHDHHEMMVEDFRKRFFVSLFVMVPILILSPMIQMFLNVDWRFSGDLMLLFLLSTVLFVVGGKPFLIGSLDELKKKEPAMMTLIAFAITTAYIYSTAAVFLKIGNDFFWELATLIVIMLLGHWIEMKSVMGASNALNELLKLMPEEAHFIQEDGKTAEVLVARLKKGDHILVKPGEKIPIDGIVFEGNSEVNESMITGESVPVVKQKEAEVIGGSINGDGILKFTVSKTGDETFLSQVVRLVKEAQLSKSKTQRLADIAAKWLFYLAVSAGTLTFVVWYSLGAEIGFAVERAVTVIIIACPHALGLATPLVTAISTSIGAKRGLLIRDRKAFESARKIDLVVFDKTGTLTEGEFGITEIRSIDVEEEHLLTLAYSMELNSEHPIAKGIVKEGKKRELISKDVSDYQNLPGKGLKAVIDNKKVMIVSPGYIRDQEIPFDQEDYESLAHQGKTVVFVLEDEQLLGYIALSDIIRESAMTAVDTLTSMNIKSVMLTGDNHNVADFVGKKLNIDMVISEVLPQQKSEKIEELIKKGHKVAMTGDGVNDAPALARADLGIAIGAGTDVAIETADVILVKSDPNDVVNLIKLSKATYTKMIQNLVWATGYNIIAMPLAAGVLYNQGIVISPAVGAVLMSMSTVIVAINAKLLKIK
ncbi:MAG: copper-translocating P-type ATPase [Firmicutes bacterium HGW-Firmicutes-19]|nr:MAG: copper-translocating P-type ATPase [Firmicutes bacterium HGW-Firmicutes-19]